MPLTQHARRWLLRFAKVSPLAAMAALAVYFGYGEYFAPASQQAILVADIVPLRSPIDGFVTLNVGVGQQVPPAETMATVRDPTPDLSQVLSVRLQKARVEQDLDATQLVKNGVSQVLDKQGGRDAAARAALVAWKRDEAIQVDEHLQSLRAKRDYAQRTLEREARLLADGVGQQQTYDSAALALQQAESELESARTETERKKLELSSAKLGHVLGDGLGTPFTGTQTERLQLEQLGVARELAVLNATSVELAQQERQLEQRLALTSQQALSIPGSSRIWALSVANGSFVRRGDVVMELAACDTLRIRAFVGERLYETLKRGTGATVELGGARYAAEVESLIGPVVPASMAGRPFPPLSRLERKDHNLGVVLRLRSAPKEACSFLGASAKVGFDT